MLNDVIFAKASGSGLAAISVVRLSGAGAHAIIAKLCRGRLPAPRRASLRSLIDPKDHEILDQALVLIFPQGGGYTGEEAVELHLHGGAAVTEAVFAALERMGARLAAPGEFSRRALLNGSLDLAEAESVGALIHAETDLQRRQALRGLEGEIGALASGWREALLSIIGLLETGVDFVEEELGDDLIEEAAERLSALRTELTRHLQEAAEVDLRRDRPSIVLVGPPNAGKSSLLNAIAGVDRAIVSSQPGTTRDRVDLSMKIAGHEVVLSDTAGLRSTEDPVEAEGVHRTTKAMGQADRRIFVVSLDTLDAFKALRPEIESRDAVFWNKSDLSPPPEPFWSDLGEVRRFVVSAQNPGSVRQAISTLVAAADAASLPQSPLLGSERRLALVRRGETALAEAAALLNQGTSEVAIEELRQAASHLAALTGVIDQEDVLDALFSRFCIGK